MKIIARYLPQRKPWSGCIGWLLMWAGGAAAMLAANAALCRATEADSTTPIGKAGMHPAAMALLAKARHELTAGEWAASLRNFQRYLIVQPADNAAMLEYLVLSRQQHQAGNALRRLARVAANGGLGTNLVRSDWHVLIGPYPTQSEMDNLVRRSTDHHHGLPAARATGNGLTQRSPAQRVRAWRYYLLAIGAGAAGDHLAATGFGYAAGNLDSQLPGIQKFVAGQLFLRHDFAAAERELHSGIRRLNHHPDRLAMLLAMNLGQDRTDAALRLALIYRRMHKHQLLGHWLLARVFRARGQRRPEIHELLTLLSFFPNFAPAYRSLLRIAVQNKNAALTERLERLYAANFPTDPRSIIFSARNAERHGLPAEAGKLLRDGHRRYPASVRVALAIWRRDFDRHRIAQSATDIQRSLEQIPDNAALMSALLRSLLARGQTHQAVAAARAFAGRELRSGSRQAMYVELLLNLHKAEAAEKWLVRLGTVMPHRRWVTRLKVQLLEQMNKPRQALALLKVLADQPEPRVLDIQALAGMSYEQGDFITYVAQMKRILAISPANAEANNDLAYFWAQRRKHLAKSLRMANLAVREYPRDTASRDTLGWIDYRLGRFHRALEEFRIAVALPGGENAAEFLHLGDTLHKLSQNSFALHSWEHGLKLLTPAKGLSRHDQELRTRLRKRIGREKKYQALDQLPGGQGL